VTSAERLAELISGHQPCVALTGAGISTESGIPDFRSPSGLWAEFDPLDYGSIEAFRRDPERVWRFYAPRFAALTDAEPNAGHHALAALERLGLLAAVVTQNIDLLHERAGSREVVEVHGSIRNSTCPRCRRRYPLAEVLELLARTGAPACTDCGAVLKPDVVFFGELLPEAALERATELARAAGLLLVVGSSLEVYPVAGLPRETLAAGGRLAIVNRGGTPYDGEAELVVDESAGSLLTEALAALDR
jgi:NAD-dependent deacetylase